MCLTGRTTKGGHLWRKSTSRSYAGIAIHLTATCDDMMMVMSHWLLFCYNCAGCACSSRQSVNTSNSVMIKNIMTVFALHCFMYSLIITAVCVRARARARERERGGGSHHFSVTAQLVPGSMATCHCLLAHLHVIVTCKTPTFTYVNAQENIIYNIYNSLYIF
jgi:hypothetical protein